MANQYGSKLHLSDFGFSGAGGDGISDAANTSALGALTAQIGRNSPDYLGIMGKNQEGYEMLKRQATKTDSEVHSLGISAESQLKAKKIESDALIAAAKKEASGAKTGAILGAIGQVGGALIGAAAGPPGAMAGAQIGGAMASGIG